MKLARDEFVVTFDGPKANEETLIGVIKEVGYPARVVTGEEKEIVQDSSQATSAGEPDVFTEALALAKRENKPAVLDFYAEWCLPCKRMLRETFPDARVAGLLKQCILVKIDTDRHPALAKRFDVVGLPDLRLLLPDGTEYGRMLDFQKPEGFAESLRELLAASRDRRK